MKIALYIREGREQIVLTPESETEHDLLGRMTDETRVVRIYNGSFYDCQGGWTRQQAERGGEFTSSFLRDRPKDESTIIVLEPKAAEAEAQA